MDLTRELELILNKQFGVAVATNIYSDDIPQICDTLVSKLIQFHLG